VAEITALKLKHVISLDSITMSCGSVVYFLFCMLLCVGYSTRKSSWNFLKSAGDFGKKSLIVVVNIKSLRHDTILSLTW